jgi:4,5-dihydroxyphthalate decarboxylase
LKHKEFDVSEMSLAFYLMAKSKGEFPYTAIPVFPMRRFFHTNLLYNVKSGVTKMEELKGRRIGIPEYGMTMGLWLRGILEHEFGVRPSDVHWFVERTSEASIGAALRFTAPSGVMVTPIPAGDSLASMLAKGSIDACRIGTERFKSTFDRSTNAFLVDSADVRPMYPYPKEEQKRYFRKTGFFPINHVIVVRDEILRQQPWVGANLLGAFQRSKEVAYERIEQFVNGPNSFVWLEELVHEMNSTFGDDPYPYGLKKNKEIIETMTQYAFEQGLISRKFVPEELFSKNTLDS